MRLRMTRRMRTYTRGHRRRPRRRHRRASTACRPTSTPTGPRYDVVQQLNQSDLAFLRERARLVQAELWCTGRTLHFRTRDRRARAPSSPWCRATDLLSVRLVRRPRAPAQRGASSPATTPSSKQRRSTSGPGPDVVEAEVTGGRTGPGWSSRRSGDEHDLRVREAALTAEEAARLGAGGDAAPRPRGSSPSSGTTNGTPGHGRRQPADACELVGAPFEGDGYYVTARAPHLRPARTGFRTRFEAERADPERGGLMGLPAPADGSAPGYFGVYPALVTDIVDPDRLGRVAGPLPVAGQRRRPRRARLGDAVHAVRRRRPGPADPARGRQPGGRRVRGRQPAPALRRRRGLERARRRCRSRPSGRTTSGCCAPGPTAGWSSTTPAGAAKVTDHDAPPATRWCSTTPRQEVTVEHAGGCTVRLTATGVEVTGQRRRSTSPPPMVNVDAPIVDVQRDRQVSAR